MTHQKIGFGGGCHWCTEAVFQALKGVAKVEQGWIASDGENNTLSEAVMVYFDEAEVNLFTLIEIHLYTHKSTSQHSMRKKYRSAVYYFSKEQKKESIRILHNLQSNFTERIITKVYPFQLFKPSTQAIQNYYLKNPNKPFCERYISPKLKFLEKSFPNIVKKKATLITNST